jgi:hypothetical protein
MMYRCKTCGFCGSFIVESAEESKIGGGKPATQVQDARVEEGTLRKSLLIKVLAGILLFLLLVSLMITLAAMFGYTL